MGILGGGIMRDMLIAAIAIVPAMIATAPSQATGHSYGSGMAASRLLRCAGIRPSRPPPLLTVPRSRDLGALNTLREREGRASARISGWEAEAPSRPSKWSAFGSPKRPTTALACRFLMSAGQESGQTSPTIRRSCGKGRHESAAPSIRRAAGIT